MERRFLKRILFAWIFLILISAIITDPGLAADNPNVVRSAKHELVVGYKADNIITKGPFTNLGEFAPNPNIYETLVRLTPDFQVEPLLATRWEYKGDNTWRFHLRKGIRFHDGQEFTADAVKFTLDKAVRPSAVSLIDLGEDSVKVIDRYTVDITPTKPNRRIVERLVQAIYGIKAPGSDRSKHPVGTGPFKFLSYQKNEQLIIGRNLDYWGEKARIDRIVFKFIPDSMTRVMALQSGKVDVITHVPEEMVQQIRKNKELDVLMSPTAASHSQIRIRVNGPDSRYIVKDRAVRLAVGYALDRQVIIKGAWSNIGVVNQCELPPGILGEFSSNIDNFSYDPVLSRKLLDRAGWEMGNDGVRMKDGKRLVLSLISGYHNWGGRIAESVPQIIQSQLKDVGIEIEIIPMIDPGLKEERLKQGFGHMWLGEASQSRADPCSWPALICHTARYYGTTYSKVWSPGEHFDRIIDKALEIPDSKESQRLTVEALNILITKEAVLVPLALTYTIFGTKEEVKGLTPHPSFDETLWHKAYIQ